MRCNKKNVMPLVLFGMIILMMGSVLATITFTGVTDGQTIRQDATVSFVSSVTNMKNVTMTLYNSADAVIVSQHTNANTSSYNIVFNDLVANTYRVNVIGTNVSGVTEDTGNLYFTITGCTPMNYALWGIVMLVFVVGLLYFAYNGFIEGHAGSMISFLIMLTIAVVVVGSFSLTVLRPLC